MPTTDPVAIYGAVVATGAAAWDVYKWWYSERLKLSGFVSPNMQAFGEASTALTAGKTYTMLRIQNRGSVPCVVQLVHMRQYKNWFNQLRRKSAMQAVVNHSPLFGAPLPHRIEKGDEFSTGLLQNEEFERWSREGRLYVGISHTMSEKPFMLRVAPIEKTA